MSKGCGCLLWVIAGIVIFALIFGITCDDKHYQLKCSRDRGVEMIDHQFVDGGVE